MNLKGKSFLKLLDFTPEQIRYLLDLSADFKEKKKEFLKRYATLAKDTDASACVMCNACLPKCPQRIRIPEQMRMIHKLVKELK